MKKFLIIFTLLLGVQNQANAQFFKQLGKALEKAANTVDNVANTILGTPDTSNNNKNAQKSKNTKQGTNATREKAQVNEPTGKQPAANSQQVAKPTSLKAQPLDSVLIIKQRGIAGISLGMKISKVPKSIPGLYDGYEEDYGCEIGITYRCKVTVPGEYNYLEISDYDENDRIDRIFIQILGARIDGTDIAIGTPVSKIINTPGLKKKVDKDDPEYFELIYKGIYHVYPGRNDGDTEDVVCSIDMGFQ